MPELNPKLLKDLATLVKRYGHEEFGQLAHALEDGRLIAAIRRVLLEMAECSKQEGKKHSKVRFRSARSKASKQANTGDRGEGTHLKDWAEVIMRSKAS